jgi:hypothetical protein
MTQKIRAGDTRSSDHSGFEGTFTPTSERPSKDQHQASKYKEKIRSITLSMMSSGCQG